VTFEKGIVRTTGEYVMERFKYTLRLIDQRDPAVFSDIFIEGINTRDNQIIKCASLTPSATSALFSIQLSHCYMERQYPAMTISD
jgi:hypothetical protein